MKSVISACTIISLLYKATQDPTNGDDVRIFERQLKHGAGTVRVGIEYRLNETPRGYYFVFKCAEQGIDFEKLLQHTERKSKLKAWLATRNLNDLLNDEIYSYVLISFIDKLKHAEAQAYKAEVTLHRFAEQAFTDWLCGVASGTPVPTWETWGDVMLERCDHLCSGGRLCHPENAKLCLTQFGALEAVDLLRKAGIGEQGFDFTDYSRVANALLSEFVRYLCVRFNRESNFFRHYACSAWTMGKIRYV